MLIEKPLINNANDLSPISSEQFEKERQETNKTDKTDIESNYDFLRGIFRDMKEDKKPVLVFFSGNPNTVPKHAWSGREWDPSAPDLPHTHNNYFALSTYSPNNMGEYRRKKEQFYACHAFMLDDIGTKIPMDRLTLPPSWLIETSKGNHQAGYILETPVTDPKFADRILKAIIGAGLCDAGADGATARMARLPFGINGKSAPIFQCKLKEWRPELRYSADELIHKLELDMSEKPKKTSGEKINRPEGHEDIFFDCPSENPVISALKSRELYKNPLDGIKHDITCPWVHEHTAQVDSGTVYYEPNDFYPIGGFKCQHGHCADRKIRDLLATLTIEPSAARMKATIRVIAGEIHRISDKAEEALTNQKRYFQRGGLIVTIANDPSTKDVSVRELSQPALLSALSSASIWERYDSRSDSWAIIDPPQKIVSVVYDATNYIHLPPLNGLSHQPYLRPDGTFANDAGYDKQSGMFGIFDTKKFHFPEKLTKKDAEVALGKIADLLCEFSFAKDSDRAAALSAILTASIRPSLPLAPMFHAKAPQIGAGKSFLCKLITAFASPKYGAPTSFPHDDEECRKLLLAELLRAPAVLEFDNLTSDIIPHKSLCTTLTSEYLTGRILGVSKTTTVGTRTLFLSSGNNVSPVADMARRCLTITLDPKCETPANKVYKNTSLIQDVLKEREKFVSYALTIIRAWIVAGRPKSECTPLAGYSEWSDLCRQPLLWLGLPDCTHSISEAMSDDPDRETLGRLLHSWKYCFGHTPKMVRDAVCKSNDNNELSDVLKDIAGDKQGINRRVLGRWIKRNSNRIVDGIRIVKATGTRSAEAWKIESVLE